MTEEQSSDGIRLVPAARDDMTSSQYLAVVSVQRLSAFLSLGSSLYIIWQVLCNGDNPSSKKKSNVYHRLMLVMSFFDILSSAALFIGNWAMPEDIAYEFIQHNIGNTATCDAQGFLLLLGWLGVVISNSALSLYFLMCIKYNWSNDKLKRRLERPFHVVLLVFCLPLSIVGLVWNLYNPTVSYCLQGLYPYQCDDPSNDVPCVRGNELVYKYFNIVVNFVPAPISLIVILISMVELYRAVRAREKQAKQFASDATLKRLSDHSRQVYYRAVWYVVSFSVVWIPAIVNNNVEYSFALQMVTKFLLPLQGKFNT